MTSDVQDVEHKKNLFRQYSDKVIFVHLKYVLLITLSEIKILTRTI